MAHQNNEQNLIPFNERTEDERRELAVKAGKASGAARRKKKTMKATAKMLFDLPITSKELKQKLALLGVSTDDATYQTAVLVAMLNQAMKGNIKAAAFCRELLGEDPSLQLRRDELKLSREKFQHEKAMDERTVAADEQKASLADAIQAAYQERLKREQTGGEDR